MAEMRKRTSMSVLEMGRMLGLGKTESYWLIKKNYFKTILVGNTMRVMIDSFEEWYANQFKYQKVDGTPPGEELKKTTYSMEELGQRLGLKEATAYELVAKGHFDVVDVLGKRRVTKESFERWYASQTDYRTVEDQELDADIMASTYGLPEMARMLGVHRQTIYYIVANEDFELIKVGRYKRATKESFEKWYHNQTRYQLAEDRQEACDDDILRLAINLAFSCSLRMGELLGLTWDCIDISPTSIELGQASIFVEKELQRVNREAMADLDGKDIMFKFPPTFASTHTALVLKTPKTKTSVRKVFLPKTVAEMLVQRKADIEELKDLFGDEFVDFNLVFCSSNGKPIEGQVINRAFNKLIEEKGLPKVVFHSLRHSSITYKLKLNGGDMKSVQGDSGHAQVKMVADVYSHIIDDDRRLNAERMEAAFYSGRQATPEPVQPAATESSADDKELLLKLLQNPEMAALLKSLAKTL